MPALDPLRIHFAHRLLRARDWQHRPEFDALCEWWRRRGVGVCALVGIGGAGKTAIADRIPARGARRDARPPRPAQ